VAQLLHVGEIQIVILDLTLVGTAHTALTAAGIWSAPSGAR